MYICVQRTGINDNESLKKAIKNYPKGFSGGVSYFASSSIFDKNFDAFIEKFKVAVQDLRKLGVDVQANISTIGHSDNGVGGEPVNCEKMVDSLGNGCLCSACPRGDKFKELLKESVIPYANLHVSVLWIDDDFRLSFHAPVDYGCFCDDCIAKFNKQNGLSLKREDLRNALLSDGIIDGKKIRLLWQNFNRDAMVELAKIIADTAHEIDDNIIIGYMQINPEMVPYEIPLYDRIIEVSKNKNGEVYFRHGSGFYSDYLPYENVLKNISIGRLCSLTKSKKYKVVNLTEEVTVPYIRRSKSMKHTVLECVLGLAFAGADGVMDEAINQNELEQFKAGNVVSTMHDFNAYLTTIHDLIKDKNQIGVYPYFSPDLWSYNDNKTNLKDMDDLGASKWANLFYAGIPITFDEESASVLLLSGQTVRAMEDDKLKKWLSRGVYMDGTSAIEINKRTNGLTGVKAFNVHDMVLTGRGTSERFTDHALNGKYKNYKRINVAQMKGLGNAKLMLDGAEALSYSDNQTEAKAGLIGSSIYKNQLGGKIAVSSRGAWDEDILSIGKLEQMKNVFDYLSGGKMPVRLENTCRQGLSVWEKDDERVVFIYNTDFDTESNATLILDGSFSAEILKPDLTWESIGDGDNIKVPDILPWETAVIKLKKQ